MDINPDTFQPDKYSGILNSFVLPGDRAFSAIAKVACQEWGVWPEELVGREKAGDAVSDVDNLPLAFRSVKPSHLGHVVLARRVTWNLAGRMTDASAEEVAEVFGGYSPETVRPFMANPEIFNKFYPQPRPPMSKIVDDLMDVVKFTLELERL